MPRGVSRASFGGRSFSINSRSNFSDLGTISSQRSYPHQMPPSMTRLQEYEQEEYGQRPQLLHTPNASPQPMDTTGRQSMFDLDQYYSGSDETPNTSEEDRVHLARGARATIYSSRSNSTSTSASESRQHLYTHHATPSSSSNHLNFNDLPTRSQSRR